MLRAMTISGCAAQDTIVLSEPANGWEWHGWGTSLCWFANVIGTRHDLTEKVCRLLFHPSDGLGLNIVRYNVGGADVKRASEYRTGGAVPCYKQSADEHCDWSIDSAQVNVLLAAKRLGANRFHAFCNSPPFFWTVSGSSKGARRPFENNLNDANVHDFIAFLTDVTLHFQREHGIDFETVTCFNEPWSPTWLEPSSHQEGCYVSKRQALTLLKAVQGHPELRDRFSAYDENCVTETLLRLLFTPKWAWAPLRQIATHTYSLTNFVHMPPAHLIALFQDNALSRWWLRKWVDARKKRLVISEYGQAEDKDFARHIMRDLRTLRPSEWIYWQAVEDEGSPWGLLTVSFTTLCNVQFREKYHIMRVFTKHIQPGAHLYVPARQSTIAAYHPVDHTLSLVIVGPVSRKVGVLVGDRTATSLEVSFYNGKTGQLHTRTQHRLSERYVIPPMPARSALGMTFSLQQLPTRYENRGAAASDIHAWLLDVT